VPRVLEVEPFIEDQVAAAVGPLAAADLAELIGAV